MTRRQQAAVVAGSVAAILLGVTLAYMSHRWTVSHEPHDVGPTAASLDDGFSLLFGAFLGLAIGSLVANAVARDPSPHLAFISASIAGLVGVVVLAAAGAVDGVTAVALVVFAAFAGALAACIAGLAVIGRPVISGLFRPHA